MYLNFNFKERDNKIKMLHQSVAPPLPSNFSFSSEQHQHEQQQHAGSQPFLHKFLETREDQLINNENILIMKIYEKTSISFQHIMISNNWILTIKVISLGDLSNNISKKIYTAFFWCLHFNFLTSDNWVTWRLTYLWPTSQIACIRWWMLQYRIRRFRA